MGSHVEVSLSTPIKSPFRRDHRHLEGGADITEANKTRLVLRRQTEELRRIFETSQDLIMVMDLRDLVQISPSCETILGYRPEEMIGRSGVDFIHPDHLETSARKCGRRRGQRPKISDTRCIHKNGRGVWLHGSEHGPSRPALLLRRPDMTESRLAQETLRESEQLARGIIDTALDACPGRRAGHYPGLEHAGRKSPGLATR